MCSEKLSGERGAGAGDWANGKPGRIVSIRMVPGGQIEKRSTVARQSLSGLTSIGREAWSGTLAAQMEEGRRGIPLKGPGQAAERVYCTALYVCDVAGGAGSIRGI